MLSKRSMRRQLNRTYASVPRPKQSMQKDWALVFLMQCLFDLSAEVRLLTSCLDLVPGKLVFLNWGAR